MKLLSAKGLGIVVLAVLLTFATGIVVAEDALNIKGVVSEDGVDVELLNAVLEELNTRLSDLQAENAAIRAELERYAGIELHPNFVSGFITETLTAVEDNISQILRGGRLMGRKIKDLDALLALYDYGYIRFGMSALSNFADTYDEISFVHRRAEIANTGTADVVLHLELRDQYGVITTKRTAFDLQFVDGQWKVNYPEFFDMEDCSPDYCF